MTIRKFLAAAALSAGLVGPASAADAVKAPDYSFSILKPMPAADAKAKAEAWLKAAGKFDQAAFDKVWANAETSVLDKVADSFALGHPGFAADLATVRDPNAAAPAEVPAYLKDAKQDPFFRANAALAFAKGACKKVSVRETLDKESGVKITRVVEAGAYEEALEALNAVAADATVDPASYFFFQAVAAHATMKREAALASIIKLRDVTETPDRYMKVALLMIEDMLGWSPDPKDFSNIERLMDNSGRRLDLARPGEKTQDIQRKIVFRLDELIKELENQCKGGPGFGKGPPKIGTGSTVTPSNPAADSTIMGGAGAGRVDEKKLREYASNWGTMPADKRAAIVEEVNRDLPAKFKPMIDEYFKSLNKIHGFPNK